ncbi:MAG: c-type cytochrome [Pyrinomonadaceae bacterium]
MKTFVKIAFLALGIAAAACTQSGVTNVAVSNAMPSPTVAAATTATPDEMASAKKLYTDNCAACHKDDGTGGKIVHEGKRINPNNLTTDKFKAAPDSKLTEMISEGSPDDGMPAFKNKLSETEIAEVIKYVRTELQNKK